LGSTAHWVQSAQPLNNAESGVLASKLHLSTDAEAKFIEENEMKQKRKSEMKRIFLNSNTRNNSNQSI
jgi:hypothetical protein